MDPLAFLTTATPAIATLATATLTSVAGALMARLVEDGALLKVGCPYYGYAYCGYACYGYAYYGYTYYSVPGRRWIPSPGWRALTPWPRS